MNEKEPSEEFRNLVDDFTTPKPALSATIRVAEFHFGGESLAQAIEAAMMEVSSSLDATREIPVFDEMPAFNIVVADILTSTNIWSESHSIRAQIPQGKKRKFRYSDE